MTLKLHAFPLSPRGFKVLAVANHLGLDYEFCFCDLPKGVQKQDWFTALNPNQRMPVLEDGAFKLWESNAIIQYLASKKPGVLAPTDAQGVADMSRWLYWESTTWDAACAVLAFERLVKPFLTGAEPDPREVERGLRGFAFAAGVLEGHLAGRDYICGDKLSLADFSIGAALTIADRAQLPLAGYPEIRRWGARMADLPAWRATMALQAPPVAA
ncbi:MAG: glutathione S-transferase family protein [Vitreimonas sp.]